MGMLENGASFLNSQRRKYLSIQVLYQSKNREDINIQATIGKTLFKADDEYGVTIRTQSIDFIISVEDVPFTPVRGDKIIHLNRIYEVLAPNGEPCWKWCDSSHLMRRIHTKEIGGI